MSVSHTPGLLENAGRTLYSNSGTCIASVWCERDQEDGLMTIECTLSEDQAAANSARLAACWNICAGMTTQAITASDAFVDVLAAAERFDTIHAELVQTRFRAEEYYARIQELLPFEAQRDELLAALDRIAYIGEGTMPDEMRSIARAAIARSRK